MYKLEDVKRTRKLASSWWETVDKLRLRNQVDPLLSTLRPSRLISTNEHNKINRDRFVAATFGLRLRKDMKVRVKSFIRDSFA